MKKTIHVTLVKSTNGITQLQKSNIKGLGLKKINQIRTLENTPCVRGMIKKVMHLLKVQE
jgi:large subunit ribosomal protein L30